MNNNISVLSIKYKDNCKFFSERNLEKADAIVDEFGKYICDQNEEYLILVTLNAHCVPITANVVKSKDVQEYDAFPRDVLQIIARSGAYAVVAIRNRINCNGATIKPTPIDDKITDYFVQLTRVSNIALVDHIIVGNDNGKTIYFSYREKKKRKLSSLGKVFQDMLGDFHIDKKFFPDIPRVTNGWEKISLFSVAQSPEDLYDIIGE